MSTKKNAKSVVINLENVCSAGDVYIAFAKAKCGIEPLTREELINYNLAISTNPKTMDVLVDVITEILMDDLTSAIDSIMNAKCKCECECECEKCNEYNVEKPAKKPNIFKRFWNWITRKK